MNIQEVEEKKEYITCTCGCSIVQLMKDKDSVYLAIYEYRRNSNSWWERLKYIWQYLRKGNKYDDQVVMTLQDAEKLAKFIQTKQEDIQ